MIECVFTLDYEIYGNGTGSLKELVYEPAASLAALFRSWNARFVTFVEVAELEKIETFCSDRAIEQTKAQVRRLHEQGFEIGLHLHPQWCHAHYEQGRWVLDFSEYNLCTLPRARSAEIVSGGINYLRHVLHEPDFTPLSFRAGNWLIRPTQPAAGVLAENGIKIDSSVFKGGLQHGSALDYRQSARNGYFWKFSDDVNVPDASGDLIEVPIYTKMVPCWEMLTHKRVKAGASPGQGSKRKMNRALDFLRFRYPLKLDFCRMTLDELTSMMDNVIAADRESPSAYKPIVAIGHTKDLVDLGTVERFLAFLAWKQIPIVTFENVYRRLSGIEVPVSGAQLTA